jgi:hypothetical protein
MALHCSVGAATSLQEGHECLDRETSFANQTTQGALGELFVVRDGQATVWRVSVAENDVAAGLTIFAVADLEECSHCLATRDDRETRQIAISTVSSLIGGGIGSPCVFRLRR